MDQSTNPLRQFFRQPAIYIRLPSQGQHWPEGSLAMPQNGEIPVYPMTAIDEITYRTPDALFNGQAVVDVVQSCIPSIKNAWHMPAQDFNSIMVAIRIASYGHEMELETTCPECKNVDSFSLDLRTVLDQLQTPEYAKPFEINGLEITFRPIDFEQQNRISTEQFENSRMIQVIPQSDLSEEEKIREMKNIMARINDLTARVLALSIANIRTSTAFVTEAKFISEFLQNCDRRVFNAIRDHVVEIRQASELKPLKMKCTSCQHQHEQQLNLDQASFFATAS